MVTYLQNFICLHYQHVFQPLFYLIVKKWYSFFFFQNIIPNNLITKHTLWRFLLPERFLLISRTCDRFGSWLFSFITDLVEMIAAQSLERKGNWKYRNIFHFFLKSSWSPKALLKKLYIRLDRWWFSPLDPLGSSLPLV